MAFRFDVRAWYVSLYELRMAIWQRGTLSDATNLKTIEANSRNDKSNPLPEQDLSALAQSFGFARKYWIRLLGISVILLVPCFWHRTIVATDLGSHLYNAWLAQLIRHGQAPGLWIARQWTNVLFDLLLTGFGSLFGFAAAEKLAVSIVMLIFFWGSVAFICAATRRAPWFLMPCIAIVTYGWTFHMGFFNYYLSLGLSFFCLAILWRGKNWERIIAIAMMPLILMAHPFGFIWVVAAALYIALAETIPRRYGFILVILAGASLLLIHAYFWSHYIVEPEPGRFYRFNGLDQLVLLGSRYYMPERALLIFAIVAVAIDAIRHRKRGFWTDLSTPLQLYIVAELAILLFPRGVTFPTHVAIALITDRLTSVSAVLGCCVLAAMQPKKWHFAVSSLIAVVFFSLVYKDTGTINRMEMEVERLVTALPPGQRVVATIMPLGDSRISVQHIVDRACIGHCFDYGNYEPGSAVFRVRALPGNPYVIDDYDLATDTEEGTYVVQPEDLPLYQVYQCTESGTELCIRPLQAGEENDRLGVHPDD